MLMINCFAQKTDFMLFHLKGESYHIYVRIFLSRLRTYFDQTSWQSKVVLSSFIDLLLGFTVKILNIGTCMSEQTV